MAGECPKPQGIVVLFLPEPPRPAHRRGGGIPAQGGSGNPGAGSDPSLRQMGGGQDLELGPEDLSAPAQVGQDELESPVSSDCLSQLEVSTPQNP